MALHYKPQNPKPQAPKILEPKPQNPNPKPQWESTTLAPEFYIIATQASKVQNLGLLWPIWLTTLAPEFYIIATQASKM